MAIRHYKTAPAPLEPSVLEEVEQAAFNNNLSRNKLIRMLIKFGLKHLKEVLQAGDPRPTK